jgi:hypothetical protein
LMNDACSNKYNELLTPYSRIIICSFQPQTRQRWGRAEEYTSTFVPPGICARQRDSNAPTRSSAPLALIIVAAASESSVQASPELRRRPYGAIMGRDMSCLSLIGYSVSSVAPGQLHEKET